MDALPEELRTPPVALVALVGMPELHPQISMSLHTEQPPINALALPDFSKVAVIGGKDGSPLDAGIPAPSGVLKADWMRKHRTKVPAVLAVLFDREEVNGDPAQWMEVCGHLDNARNVIRGRNTKLVVAIVQPTLHGEINDDRMTALRKRAELDNKCCMTFISHDPTELKRSLARLGSILGELSNLYYKEQSRRVKARLDKKNWTANELGVRFNFKMGYYAEFRRDWVTALRFYETAYTLLLEVLSTPAEAQSVQRVVELKAVAEQLHFKVSTLLLHSGKEVEAIKWFKHHITRFMKFIGPSECEFIHFAWISQQYHVFGDLLKTSRASASSSTIPLAGSGVAERELQPGYYYQIAARYVTERRRIFERAFATFESFDNPDGVDVLAGSSEEIGPPLYVGQAPRILSRSSDQQSPTPDEFIRHAMLTERQLSHSHAAISLLTKAHEQYKIIQAPHYLGTEMGREYLQAGDYENSKRLFDSVAGIYRKEAWVELLAASLEYLRESSKHLGLNKEFLEYSLELASLPEERWSEVARRSDALTDVIAAIAGTDGVSDDPIALEVDLVSPLRGVLSVCVAFHDQTVKPGTTTRLTISLLTHLLHPLEVDDLEINFNQADCNLLLKRSPDYELKLMPHRWKRFEVDIVAGSSGKLECLFAVARLGQNLTVRCQVESPASREPDPFWQFEPAIESYPVGDKHLDFLGQKVIQVEEVEPKVDIEIEPGSIALVGESAPIRIRVRSRGHAVDSGELQLTVSDSSRGDARQSFSPTTPSTSPSAACAKVFFPARLKDGTGETMLWELRGSIKVPYVEVDGSWSGSAYIRFTEPRPITLTVALGYQIQLGANAEAHKLWTYKHIQLGCDEALRINCRYMPPYQRDAFLPGSLDRSASTVLPLDETSTMILAAKNICSVPLLVSPVQVEESNPSSCQVRRLERNGSAVSRSTDPIRLLPDEVLSVKPLTAAPALDIGLVSLQWERADRNQNVEEAVEVSGIDEVLPNTDAASGAALESFATTRLGLPVIAADGLLGKPLTMSLRIQNRTGSVQEVKFSVLDAQSFLVSGASRGSVSVLPSLTESVSLALVPIAAGMQQLPQVSLTLVSFNASYQPPGKSTQLFVFPSQPNLQPQCVESFRKESRIFY